MSSLFLLSDQQMASIKSYFPRPHGKPRVDDQRVIRVRSHLSTVHRKDLNQSNVAAMAMPAA